MDFGYRDLFAHMLKPKSPAHLESTPDEIVLGEIPATKKNQN